VTIDDGDTNISGEDNEIEVDKTSNGWLLVKDRENVLLGDSDSIAPNTVTQIEIFLHAGDDRVTLTVTVSEAAGFTNLDRVLAWMGPGTDHYSGWEGVDDVGGEAGADEIFGLEGNDALAGGNGNDTIYGGGDNDDMAV
jgi:Ca2+-binding RTX toxin-like protein